MVNEIARRIQERSRFYGSCWERDCERLYRSIFSFKDITKALSSKEPNVLIFSMREIIPVIADTLSPAQIKEIAKQVEAHKLNYAMCEISYGGFQADEDDSTTVSEAARVASNSIEKYLN